MKIYADIQQGTDEWKRLRKGKPTASRFSEILTATGALSKSSRGYIMELIGECFAPDFEYFYGNAYTERGTAVEGEAREAFSQKTGLTVCQVGFVVGDDGVCGCSPDGLILDSASVPMAGVEIKCPTPKVHIGYVMDGVLPDTYKQQVHGSMAVTGLTEWHFFSYFPGLQPLHVVVGWDDYTEKLADSLKAFVTEYRTQMAIAVKKLTLQ